MPLRAIGAGRGAVAPAGGLNHLDMRGRRRLELRSNCPHTGVIPHTIDEYQRALSAGLVIDGGTGLLEHAEIPPDGTDGTPQLLCRRLDDHAGGSVKQVE